MLVAISEQEVRLRWTGMFVGELSETLSAAPDVLDEMREKRMSAQYVFPGLRIVEIQGKLIQFVLVYDAHVKQTNIMATADIRDVPSRRRFIRHHWDLR